MGNLVLYTTSDLIQYLNDINISYHFNGIHNNFETYSTLDNTVENSVTWARKHTIDISILKSSILIVPMNFDKTSGTISIFKVDDPRRFFSLLLNQYFNPEKELTGISKNSTCHESVQFGKGIYLGDFSTIGKNCKLGNNVKIFPNVHIYANTIIGDNVIIHSGCVIGSPGFGYTRNEENILEHFVHVGNVQIGNNVDIGANTCIDRATMGSTYIGDNTKISNFCQIAHNVKVGENCLVTGKVQIGGGTIIGKDVYLGPSSIIMNKLLIGNGADIKMGSIVVKHVAANTSVSGNFATDHKKRLRDSVKIQRLIKG